MCVMLVRIIECAWNKTFHISRYLNMSVYFYHYNALERIDLCILERKSNSLEIVSSFWWYQCISNFDKATRFASVKLDSNLNFTARYKWWFEGVFELSLFNVSSIILTGCRNERWRITEYLMNWHILAHCMCSPQCSFTVLTDTRLSNLSNIITFLTTPEYNRQNHNFYSGTFEFKYDLNPLLEYTIIQWNLFNCA